MGVGGGCRGRLLDTPAERVGQGRVVHPPIGGVKVGGEGVGEVGRGEWWAVGVWGPGALAQLLVYISGLIFLLQFMMHVK